MVFDCHTHLANPEHLGGMFMEGAKLAWGDDYRMACSAPEHEKALKQCDGGIVLAMDAEEAGFYVPNELVAQYVGRNPSRLFGFASVNPNRENPGRILENAKHEYGLKGLKLAPIYQMFDPLDEACRPLYAKAQELRMPVMWHQGTSFISSGPLELSRPVLLDPVARAFPGLVMIIAHMGHPWYEETSCVARKHKNVYIDVSALGTRPWQMYNALICALEYGVGDKLLFGSDFPFFDCETTMASLRGVNDIVRGTCLPRVPERLVEEIIGRNTPEILGIA